MNDIRDLLIDTLSSYNIPVILQGSLTEEEPYPDLFFTFWNNATNGTAFYDNEENGYIWDFDVNVYGVDPTAVWETLVNAKEDLKTNGFTFVEFHDVMSDEISHTGRGMTVIYL